ncbi:hypothetical protein PIB30_029533 [Stylosanthes scabra]|uniref:Uncharacterized protein n=1 Tax=Stylosanthes scabra TaxID=79078 RepID=A0ABU6UE02_9FABA|nr:hypothetical protein [Stylosanthes scabra]
MGFNQEDEEMEAEEEEAQNDDEEIEAEAEQGLDSDDEFADYFDLAPPPSPDSSVGSPSSSGQGKKSKNWMGTESLVNPIHRVNERKHDRAEFGAEVAKKGEMNEKIATKPRRPLLEPMRTHQEKPCVRIIGLGGTPKC